MQFKSFSRHSLGSRLQLWRPAPAILSPALIAAFSLGYSLPSAAQVGATSCQSPYSEVYAVTQPAGTTGDFYAIHAPTGAAIKFTSAPASFGLTAINTAATDHVNKLVYYGDGNRIYAWDAIANQHITVAANFQSLLTAAGYTGTFSTLSSGGAAFYGGALYVGVDGSQSPFVQDFEIFRVDFSSDGKTAVSATPLGIRASSSGVITTATLEDWGDFTISDAGVILALSNNRSAGQRRFWKFNLLNNTFSLVNSTTENAQLAKSGDGRLWGLRSSSVVQFDSNGTVIGGPVSTTVQAFDGAECVVGAAQAGDRVWRDANQNGIQDPTEVGIAGVTVAIYRDIDKDGVIDSTDPKLATQVTDATGNYAFGDLLPHDRLTGSGHNDFIIRVESGVPAGLTATTPTQKTIDFASATEVIDTADFGYYGNHPPVTTDLTNPSQPNPGGSNRVQVPTLAGSDPEDGPLGSGQSFRIVTLPTNGTLYYQGVAVTAGQTLTNYDPTQLRLDPNDGAITVSFTYAAVDSAGLADATPAQVTLPFSAPAAITCPAGTVGTGSGYATSGLGQYITKNSIYWLDWSCGSTTQFDPGATVTKTWTAPNGISITATLSGITKALTGYNTGSYSGDKLDDLYSGINPIGLINVQDGEDPNYSISFTMSLNGRPIPADIVTAEAESTDGPNESATWTTDGDPWEVLEVAPSSSLDIRFSNGGKTLFMSDNPDRGFGSVLALAENVATVNVQMNAGGKEAIAFGIMVPFDYGDAPASYGSAAHYARRDATGGSKPTSLTPANGLTLASLNFNTPYLGAIGADPETTNQPTAAADGDQLNGVSDEDAFAVFPDVASAGTYRLNNIPVHNTTGGNTTLYAWIDFNKNGQFEAGEFSSALVPPNATTANLSWAVPTGTTEGPTYARFRITSDSLVDDPATLGVDERAIATALDGEVEDYRGNLTLPNLLLVKRITAINGQARTFGGTDLATYQDDPTNPYDDNILQSPAPTPKDTQYWPTPSSFLLGNTNGDFIRPNDAVEYTIYYLSTGSAAARNVLFCDRVPSNVSFIPTAFNTGFALESTSLAGSDRGILVNRGGAVRAYSNTSDGDDAFYLAPGVDPTSLFPSLNCGGPNTNGAVVVRLGNLNAATAPATPPSSYGFVRFRGRVK
jgi:uncharacterized repeat protein (TIGR01451 family)